MRFVMIDRIIEWKPGESAKAIKSVAMSEDYFTDHFPGYPVMPGVLIIECMAQLSGVLIEDAYFTTYNQVVSPIMSIVEGMKFRSMARPGDLLTIETKILTFNEDMGKVNCKATVEGKAIASGTIVYSIFKDEGLNSERKRDYHKLWTTE